MKEFDLTTTLAAVAKIEHNRELNGNETKYTGTTYAKYRNGKMYLDGEEIEVNAQSFASPLVYKFAIRLDEKPVFQDQVKNLDPMLRMTKGLVMIKYTPRGSKDYRVGRPFKIGQDLIRWDIRVSGPREWEMLAQRVPELKWLMRNTTLNREMFSLAAQHPGMTFWCNVDWPKYAKKLQEQCPEISERPFACHKTSLKDYKEIYKSQDKTLIIRCLNDIISDVNKVELDPSVQEEMMETAGETWQRKHLQQEHDEHGYFKKKHKEI